MCSLEIDAQDSQILEESGIQASKIHVARFNMLQNGIPPHLEKMYKIHPEPAKLLEQTNGSNVHTLVQNRLSNLESNYILESERPSKDQVELQVN